MSTKASSYFTQEPIKERIDPKIELETDIEKVLSPLGDYRRLCAQINEQQYEYTKTGKLRFWHPPNSHDDQLWALSLSVYASKEEERGILARAW